MALIPFCPRTASPVIGGISALLVTLVVSAALGAPAQPSKTDIADPAPADSSVLFSGNGSSYWGAIPPSTDSTTTEFKNRGRKAWEWALTIPYSVINLPLRYLRLGTSGGIVWLDEHGVFRFFSLIPIPRGVVPGVDYSSLEGLGLTLKYFDELGAPSNPLRIRATYSTNQWQKYTVGAMFNQDGKAELQMGGGYRLRPDLRFFGIGPNSSREDESFYKDERAWAGASLRYRFTPDVSVAFLGAFSSVDACKPDEGRDPSVGDKFPGDETPPGYDGRSEGVMLRLAAVHNSAHNRGNPERGTILGGTVGGFISTDGNDVSFLAYRFEFQQFIPLWHQRRALALRAYLNWIDDRGDTPVPFQRMFINEVPDQFRGFDSSRWRDVGITGITFEYRFPLLAVRSDGGFGLDWVFMADIGQVFGEFDQIKTENLTESYGFGFRSYLAPHFLGSMEFVWSDDDFQFRLSTKQLFQFSRDVIYLGREETLIH